MRDRNRQSHEEVEGELWTQQQRYCILAPTLKKSPSESRGAARWCVGSDTRKCVHIDIQSVSLIKNHNTTKKKKKKGGEA